MNSKLTPPRKLFGRRPMAAKASERSLSPRTQPSAGYIASEAPSIDKLESFAYYTRCRVVRKIAEGGMGAVYLGEQLGEAGFAKPVAIKVIRPALVQQPNALRMFLDEAKLVAELVHPNIVQVHNLGIFQGMYFVVMEYLHGKSVLDYRYTCLQLGCLPPAEFSAFIVSRICRGLEYAHTKRDRHGKHLGIVHRDVTPSNIMMDFRGSVKLTDFGIAKALTMNMPDEKKTIMGKFSYMAPEQVMAQGTDPRTDLFSLGLVLHELLTGQRVFRAETLPELLRLLTTPIADPRQQAAELPPALCEICMKALALDPAARFQSAAEFGNALEGYLYKDGYGPTNEKLAKHILELWPDADRDLIS